MQALESHRIDFVWVYEGWEVIQAQRQGVKLNIFPITSYGIPDYYTPNLIASPTEIKQKPELLRKSFCWQLLVAMNMRVPILNRQPRWSWTRPEVPAGTFPDPGLVLASQAYLSPRYADPGRQWGLQDASAWHAYPQFIVDAGGVLDANNKPVHSMNLDALYTNQFLP